MKFWITIACLFYAQFIVGQNTLPMQNGHFRICNGVITDSENGKTKGNYDHNENYTLVLSLPGSSSISLKFNNFCTEIDNDVLRIFDGKDTNATLLGKYSGSKNPGTVTSSNSFITLHFISDKSVACSGWSADIIPKIVAPKAAVLSLISPVNCNDSLVEVKLDQKITIDSFNINNTSINRGKIWKITPVNTISGKSDRFILHITNLNINGKFNIEHRHGYRDYCDSVYWLKSILNWSIINCPIKVELTANKDTICRGDCLDLLVLASGGDSTKYKYLWKPNISNKSKVTVCPKTNTSYIVEVSDGNAVNGKDTLNIVVLDPPKVQADTSVCYYSSNFKLSASPVGGKWFGKGIVNSTTGEFKPLGNYGVCKVWYQIGSCADTVLVTVSIPYNYDNVFCPSNKASMVYWYGPTGGIWEGDKITSNGMFTPDSNGVYTVKYTWKGCVSNKKITVENISVPEFDTTCESTLRDTLKFAPLGIIPTYFVGLINSYYGWYNPSLMGGPGTKNIIFQGRGSCRDTTKLTILPCFAGKDDTLCPGSQSAVFELTNFRSDTEHWWTGKGIANPNKDEYNTNWTQNNDGIDTVWLHSKGCKDFKLIYLKKTQISPKDTWEVCPNIDTLEIESYFKPNVSGGLWEVNSNKGPFIDVKNALKNGINEISYSANGCEDIGYIKLLPQPLKPSDTSICENSKPIELKLKENGFLTGYGVSGQFILPSELEIGKNTLIFTNIKGCKDSFIIQVDTLDKIDFSNLSRFYCFSSQKVKLTATPNNGQFYWNNGADSGTEIITKNLKSGNHKIQYVVQLNSCISRDSTSIFIADSIETIVSPAADSLCYGESVLIEATSSGGQGNYIYTWSHGQNGNKTFITPTKDVNLFLTVSDGCSDELNIDIPIKVHPRIWFEISVNPPLCYGSKGFAYPRLTNGNKANWIWSPSGSIQNDTFYYLVGNSCKLFAVENETGCFSDTTIELPGYPGINASFTLRPPQLGKCYSPLDEKLEIFDQSSGGTNGEWFFENDKIKDYLPYESWAAPIPFQNQSTRIKLLVRNDDGCLDSSEISFCLKDSVFIWVPNSFTPNNDGINDKLIWKILGGEEIEVAIYNLWGEKVFNSNYIDGYWDGTYLDQDCMEGNYIFMVKYRGRKSANRVLSVPILLLRAESE